MAILVPHRETNLAAVRSNAVADIDPGSGSLGGQAALDGPPSAIAVAPNAIWVAVDRDGTVSRIDPKTHTVRQTVRVGHGQSTLAADRGGVWAANYEDGTLTRISSATNAKADSLHAGSPTGVCWHGGELWVAGAAVGSLLRYDPETRRRRTVVLSGQPVRAGLRRERSVGDCRGAARSTSTRRPGRRDPRSTSAPAFRPSPSPTTRCGWRTR